MAYYFLVASLPSLEFPTPPEISFNEVISRCKMNLGKRELEQVRLIQLYVDLTNIKRLLYAEPLDSRGTLTSSEMETTLALKEGLPEYVFDFFKRFETVTDRLRNFSYILVQFFLMAQEKACPFLKKYFQFEREFRLVTTTYRAKKLKLDILSQLQHEDGSDYFVNQLLAQKDSTFFEAPYGYEDLGEILNATEGNPKKQYFEIAAYRYHKIDEMAGDDFYSLDWILGYLLKLMILEDVSVLSEDAGQHLLNTIVKESA